MVDHEGELDFSRSMDDSLHRPNREIDGGVTSWVEMEREISTAPNDGGSFDQVDAKWKGNRMQKDFSKR